MQNIDASSWLRGLGTRVCRHGTYESDIPVEPTRITVFAPAPRLSTFSRDHRRPVVEMSVASAVQVVPEDGRGMYDILGVPSRLVYRGPHVASV